MSNRIRDRTYNDGRNQCSGLKFHIHIHMYTQYANIHYYSTVQFNTHTHTQIYTHVRAHTNTHTDIHTHTHTLYIWSLNNKAADGRSAGRGVIMAVITEHNSTERYCTNSSGRFPRRSWCQRGPLPGSSKSQLSSSMLIPRLCTYVRERNKRG